MEAKVITIAGLNASGKTLLAERMRRDMKSDSVRYVAFCDTYGTATDRSYYLQQRWNQHDIDSETPTVAAALERSFNLSGSDTTERRQLQAHLYRLMGMEPLLDKYVISLSSGELRKMHLVKTLMAQPKTLILDNPFIGLDAEARTMLTHQLLRLRQEGMTLYLIVARPSEIPDFTDEIIWTTPEATFRDSSYTLSPQPDGLPLLPVSPSVATESQPTQKEKTITSHSTEQNGNETDGETVIEMHDVSVSYGHRRILGPLTWTVRRGERWALSGRNGSGKSTLLSLICADNPQSYACDIALFGKKRGSGESIWDIKRRIGYVSPEMHRSYLRNLPALHIVASGLKDTVGLYARPTAQERQQCQCWMDRFGIGQLASRSFMQLSSGEQRLVLVCRAFVKNPDLLILDEPMHGLDLQRQQLVKRIIEAFCQQTDKTLIMVTHYEEELPRCMTHSIHL